MFIDVCFPQNNEKEFVKIAEKLFFNGLCFVYDKKKTTKTKSNLLIYNCIKQNSNPKALFKSFSLDKSRKINYFDSLQRSRSYHFPLKLTQVNIKEMKGKLLGIPYHYVKEGFHNPNIIENLIFFLKLCAKYDVKIFVASFAKNPYELRSTKELQSVLNYLKLNSKLIKMSVENLFFYLKI
jgi:RNase P/RNase MRP subunit p30